MELKGNEEDSKEDSKLGGRFYDFQKVNILIYFIIFLVILRSGIGGDLVGSSVHHPNFPYMQCFLTNSS